MADLAHRHYAALVLPFDTNGKVDETAYREMIRYFLQERFRAVGGIVANPEAGEVYYLTREEKRRVAEIAVDEAGGKMPVFGGVFDLTTEGSVASSAHATEPSVLRSKTPPNTGILPPASSTAIWATRRFSSRVK